MGEHRKVLVAACPRSGTQYTAALLKKSGLKVRHENVGVDGCVSWWFGSASSPVDPGYGNSSVAHEDRKRPQDFTFDVTAHLIRHPLSCCPSIIGFPFFTKSVWRYIEANTGIHVSMPDPTRTVKFWVSWNKEIAKRADLTLRLEHMAEDWPAFARALDLSSEAVPTIKAVNVRRNLKGWTPRYFAWSEVDRRVALDAFRLAEQFGYDASRQPAREHTVTGEALDKPRKQDR